MFAATVILALSAALAACGGDDGQEATSAPEATPTEVATPEATATAETDTDAEDDSGPSLICEEPAPVPIELGSTFTGDNSAAFTVCFFIEVSTELTQLSITLSDLTDNLDMGVSFGDIETIQYPGTGEYWRSGEADTLDEMLTLENPAAGIYWIAVGPGGYKNLSPFTLSVSGIQ